MSPTVGVGWGGLIERTVTTSSLAAKLIYFRAWLCSTVQPQAGSHVPAARPPWLPKIELTHMVGVSAKGTMLNAISRSGVTGNWEVTLMKMEWRDFGLASAGIIKKKKISDCADIKTRGASWWKCSVVVCVQEDLVTLTPTQLHIHRGDKRQQKHNDRSDLKKGVQCAIIILTYHALLGVKSSWLALWRLVLSFIDY